MAGFLFVSESPVALSAPILPDLSASFAASSPFTIWSDRVGGIDYSSTLFTVDGTTVLDPASDLVTDGSGQIPPFRGPDGTPPPPMLWIDMGGLRAPIISPEAIALLLLAWLDGTISGSGILGAPSVWPATFPSDLHTHLASDIRNATPVGIALMVAIDGQTARAAIGAGTGNGTSNLKIGPLATDAAAGNHNHQAANLGFAPSGPITATDIQNAILQAAASTGSIGGASSIFVWQYSAGAYPALPATKPTGVLRVDAEGPVAPAASPLPSWIGLTPGLATLRYDAAART